MSRLTQTFHRGKALITFLTARDPDLATSESLILSMADAGADIIEIGIPFSDPIAEGKVIEAANLRALSGGVTPEDVFVMVERVRAKTDVPLVFLTYVNPVFTYGYERFFTRCRNVGIDGIILPDLPFEERGELLSNAKESQVDVISLIAPTSEQRIAQIASAATGFIYLVSSLGVTGVRSEIKTDLGAMVSTIRSASDTPVAVGFGISTPEQARDIALVSDGVIVGSAIVKIIERYGTEASTPVSAFVRSMKEALL